MRDQNREVRLTQRPGSLPGPENFAIVQTPIPRPGPGEVLVRNLYFRLEASLRMMISVGAEDVEGVPFPAIREGQVPGAETLGEVIEAAEGAGLAPGDLVLHHAGWREFACLPASSCQKAPGDLSEPAAHLSHGWTAYAALTRGAPVRPGGVVFVSSAAGAIGSMAGQIARLLGAGRVIGSTSSRSKAQRLVQELGYDAGLAREAGPLGAQLSAVAPDGVDLWLDMVGGEQLGDAVAGMRARGVILVLGALSGQLSPSGSGRRAPALIDSFPLLLKELSIRGYSADSHAEARTEWTLCFDVWRRSGAIKFPHEIIEGLERAPAALGAVSRGEYFGTALVKL